jgi:peptidyl-prolyl cis-trans isomerase B (cyclophilin B)
VEDPQVRENTIEAAFACAEFELARRCLLELKQHGQLSQQQAQRLDLIDQYLVEWQREQTLREAEQAAADLPRVVLVTVRGDMELELFENEAPNTVANFIALVEDGFYDGLTFHEVESRFAAISGCPIGDGTGSPGHFIRHEFPSPNRRVHFRGSISTVSEGGVASGSQFHLTFLPTPELEGTCTVFGRIVRGLEVLARLQRRGTDAMSALAAPDQIVFARVIRKRDHRYEPDRIPDPTAELRRQNAQLRQKYLTRQ